MLSYLDDSKLCLENLSLCNSTDEAEFALRKLDDLNLKVFHASDSENEDDLGRHQSILDLTLAIAIIKELAAKYYGIR